MLAAAAVSVSTVVAIVALCVSALAAIASYRYGQRGVTLARQANQLPAFVDLFREHRSAHLADARHYVASEDFAALDHARGMAALPMDQRALVRDLMWFYDNVGALVTHEVVDLDPIAIYLGGSVELCWTKLEQLVKAERERRRNFPDPDRWQEYFQNLRELVRERGPAARQRGQWRI